MSQYRPKGGMCIRCNNLHEDCSSLPFNTYPVALTAKEHKKALVMNDSVPVICKEFVRNESDSAED